MKTFRIPLLSMSLLGFGLLSGLDAPTARADFTLGPPVSAPYGGVMGFSADGLEVYFSANMAGGQGNTDLWLCKRVSPEDDWGSPENLGPTVNTASVDFNPSITADGLELYFLSNRPGSYGGGTYGDIYMTRRATRNSAWGPPTNLGPKVNSAYADGNAWVSSDGLELYHASDRPGGSSAYSYNICDLYVSKRATRQDPWGDSLSLGPAVNSTATEDAPCLSPDGLLLLFVSGRPEGYGANDLWMTRRAGRSAPWEPAVNLGPRINSSLKDTIPVLAPDGSTLYFQQGSGNTWTLWETPILPVMDFNGDGMVDLQDLVVLIEHWGQTDPPCDIGPMPWGDGKVDANDLEVLMRHWSQEVNDPTLIAHWSLDETTGVTAMDSAGTNNVMLVGSPTWQPMGGKIGGALEFDGKDDFACSGSTVLDPSKGPFSVIAWVKGAALGRVILSQASAADWLYVDQSGVLTTDLMSSDRKKGKALTSSALLTNDQWHRVVLTWDGTNRTLQVDGIEVARDTQPSLAASSGNLNIGVGKTFGATTYWTGLIDEVRVYNRAVQP